jgi:hypothetical protein
MDRRINDRNQSHGRGEKANGNKKNKSHETRIQFYTLIFTIYLEFLFMLYGSENSFD